MVDLVLVLDPHEPVRDTLVSVVTRAGYKAVSALSSAEALARTTSAAVILVIADIAAVQPVAYFVRQLRLLPNCPALIVLDAQPSTGGAVSALQAGASGYLAKGSPPEHLVATVETALEKRVIERRYDTLMRDMKQLLSTVQELLGVLPAGSAHAPSQASRPLRARRQALVVGQLRLSRERREVFCAGKPLPVTPIEHRLLICLAEQAGLLLSYQAIVRHTHGHEVSQAEAMLLLKTHVRNLRRKLPAGYLVCERATGYLLRDPLADSQATEAGLGLRERTPGEDR
jgi:two-component system, OmpR family, KDP operon response regulator KdpE